MSWRVLAVDSQETSKQKQSAQNVLDGKPLTCWHTEWSGKRPGFPHELSLDLGQSRTLDGLRILPRQDRAQNGRIRELEIYVADTPDAWGKPVLQAKLRNTLDEQELRLPSVVGRFLRVVARSGYSKDIAAIAELNLVGQ
jgi:hypothetical protein